MSHSYKLRDDPYVYQTGQPIQHGYDNKSYADPYGGSHTYSTPYSHDPRDSRAPRASRDPMARADYSREKKNRRCMIIAIVVLVLLVAGAIAVGVYFGVKSSEDDKDKAEIAAATAELYVTLNEPWDSKLEDHTSQEFQDKKQYVEAGMTPRSLKREIHRSVWFALHVCLHTPNIDDDMTVMDTLLQDEPDYISNKVTEFSEGSIESRFHIKLRQEVSTSYLQDKVNQKAAAMSGRNKFAQDIVQSKTSVLAVKAGDVANVDIGGVCSNRNDCEDKNTICTSSPKKCACNINYYEMNGRCFAGKRHGEDCTASKMCTDLDNECKSRKCDCIATKFRKNNACVPKIDINMQGCSEDNHCKYRGATCEMMSNSGTCKCPGETFTSTSQERCALKYDIGESGCTSASQCKIGSCLSNTCTCGPGKFYDIGKKNCEDGDEPSYCDMASLQERVLQGECKESFESYYDSGDPEEFQLFLICMWVEAYVRDQECDLQALIGYLGKTDLHTGLATMALPLCIKRLEFNIGVDVDISSLENDKALVKITLPNVFYEDDRYLALAVTDSASMFNSVVFVTENYINPESYNMNLRVIRTQRGISDPVKADVQKRNRIRYRDEHIYIMFEVDKTDIPDPVSELSFSGQKYVLVAYGGINAQNVMQVHSLKAWTTSRLDLDCSMTVGQKLLEMRSEGPTNKQGLCSNKWIGRHLALYKCVRIIASYNLTEKCWVRIAARGCFKKFMSKKGITCQDDEIDSALDDDFVRRNLLESLPPKTCEAQLTLTHCERLWLESAVDLSECQLPMMMGSILTKYWPNFGTIKGSDGETLLKCSLWIGSFQCMSKFFLETQCKVADIQNIVAAATGMAQRYLVNTIYMESTIFKKDEFSIINYQQGCTVPADFTPQIGSCPSVDLVADVIVASCSVSILYAWELKRTIYPTLNMCDISILECAHGNVEDMLKLFGCRDDPGKTIEEVMKAKASWLKQLFGYDLVGCVQQQYCMEQISKHEDCLAPFGILGIEHLLENRNEKCASAKTVTEVLLPACFQRHNIPDQCKAADIWNYVLDYYKSLNYTQNGFDGCLVQSIDICAALPISTLFTCYGQYYLSGGCSIISCIEAAEVPPGVNCLFDTEQVYEKAELIYEERPKCDPHYEELVRCYTQFSSSPCGVYFGLLDAEDKFEDTNEKCGVVKLFVDELLPKCIDDNNLDVTCKPFLLEIWNAGIGARLEEENIDDSEFHKCEGYQVNQCRADAAVGLLRCYGKNYPDDCSMNECIQAATASPGCPELDRSAMYNLANEIYGVPPLCACGEGVFEVASTLLCGAAWEDWVKFQDCGSYEAFLSCIGYNYMIHGKDICNYEEAHKNIEKDSAASRKPDQKTPDICGTGSTKYADLEQKNPSSKEEVCTNTFVMEVMLVYFCKADEFLFTGTDQRSKCMSETSRRYCVYLIIRGSGIDSCSKEIAWNTMSSLNTFDSNLNCGYPCVEFVMDNSGTYGICIHGVNQFLYMSILNPAISAMPAYESPNKLLKCRVFDTATTCALNKAGQCASSVQDVQNALKILANYESGQVAAEVPSLKADTFDNCVYTAPTDVCPNNNEMLYSFVSFCGFGPMLAYSEGYNEIACIYQWFCSLSVPGIYEEYGCTDAGSYLEELSAPEVGEYVKEVTNMICDPENDPDVSECVEHTNTHTQCQGLFGLLHLGPELNEHQRCQSVNLLKNELLPECYQRHNVPAKCHGLVEEIYRVFHNAHKKNNGIDGESGFECQGYEGSCGANNVLTLFKCFAKEPVDGLCGVDRCIKAAANADSDCEDKVDLATVYQHGDDIYGRHPICENGKGVLDLAIHQLCSEIWIVWLTSTGTDKCEAYKHFLFCIAYHYVIAEITFTDFATLHQNVLADATIKGHTPELCQGVTTQMLDIEMPDSKEGICGREAVETTIQTYYCPPVPTTLFIGETNKKNCMATLSRKQCLVNSLREGDCTYDSVSTDGSAQCESSYPCVANVLRKATELNDCVSGITYFLLLQLYRIDVNTAPARDPTEKLKCRVWEVHTNCAYLNVEPTCQSQERYNEVRSGFQVLLAANNDIWTTYPTVPRVDIFNECTNVSLPTGPCPTKYELMTITLARCGGYAMYIAYDLLNPDAACSILLECLKAAADGYSTLCTSTNVYLGESFEQNSRDYLHSVTGIKCPKPEKIGDCPDIPSDQLGTCPEACSNDYFCKGDQKCCSNGCGHTCQDPDYD